VRREDAAFPGNEALPAVPAVNGDLPSLITQVFEQVKWDIKMLIASELGRIANDEDLRGLILSKDL
jgi:hypothetical protein